MEIEFLSQTDRPLEKVLIELIEQHPKISIATAFLSNDGLKIIQNDLNGKNIRVICGVNGSISDLHSLKNLIARSNSAVEGRVFTGNNLFHPKLYIFQNDNDATIIVGSPNLTGRGLNHNEEVCIKVCGSLSDAPILSAVGYFEKIWKSNSVSVEEYLLEHPEYNKLDLQEQLSSKQKEVLKRLEDRAFESSSIKFSNPVNKTFFNKGGQTVPTEFNSLIKELNLCELHRSIPFEIILPDNFRADGRF